MLIKNHFGIKHSHIENKCCLILMNNRDRLDRISGPYETPCTGYPARLKHRIPDIQPVWNTVYQISGPYETPYTGYPAIYIFFARISAIYIDKMMDNEQYHLHKKMLILAGEQIYVVVVYHVTIGLLKKFWPFWY